MFSLNVNNHYYTRYEKIIQHYKTNSVSVYSEKHHIIPKSLGGANNGENIVRLCARAHFICHYLLWKMMPIGTVERKKMAYAFNQMKRIGTNSRLYSNFREEFSIYVGVDKAGNAYCKGLKTYYNPADEKIKRGKNVPEGYIEGVPKSSSNWKENRVKITDGISERWHEKRLEIPSGWKLGRADSFKKKVAISSLGNKNNTGKTYTRTQETKDKLSSLKKGKLPPNVGKSQYHNPQTGKKIWADSNSVPDGYVPGWGKSFSESIKAGMIS